jgi:hypothetical protein
MTDTERLLRDAFLAECWRPIREHHNPPPAGPADPEAPARRQQLDTFFGDTTTH